MLNILQGVISSFIATLCVKIWGIDKKDQVSEKKTGSVETSDNSEVAIDQTAPENGTVKKMTGKIKTGTGSSVTIKQ